MIPVALPLAASAAGPCLSQTLARGSRGSEVSTLQQYLVAEKLLAADGATGYFGSMTEAAVQKWQVVNGPVTSGTPATTGFGTVGAKTRALLCNHASTPTNAATSASIPATTTVPTTPVVTTSATATAPIVDSGVGKKPDIWSFRVSAETIQAPGEMVTFNWTVYDAASCDVSTTEGTLLSKNLSPIATLDVLPQKPTTFVLVCRGTGDGTIAAPKSATSTKHVRVVHVAPTCELAFDKSTYKFGDTIKLSWKSTGADYGTWQQTIGDNYPMPYGKIATEGQYFFGVNGSVTQTMRLVVTGRGGTGECSASVYVAPLAASRGFFSQLAALGAGLLYPPVRR